MAKEQTRKIEAPEGNVTRVRASTVSSAVRNIQTWLRECLFTIIEGDDGGVRFARVIARHLVKGNHRGEEVFTIDVPKKAGEEWCDLAGMEMWSKLQTETASLGGLQKYALYAYHTGDNEAHTSRFIVRLQGYNDEDDADGINSENPDKTGLVSQAMRHAEVYAKAMSGMVMGLMSGYQATMSRQTSMIEKLMDDKLEGIEAIQEMLSMKDERDVKMIQARAKAKGIEDLVGKLGILLPAVANKVSGKELFPVQESSVMMMTKGLLGSIMANPDRVDQIMGMLSAEEQIALMNLYESISTKDKEDKEKALALKKSE